MESLFISYCTEYELHWGSRPDGFMIGTSREVMMAHIDESNETGSYECFWRYSEPEEIFCQESDFQEIKKRMNGKELAFYNDNEKSKLNLYNKV